MFFFFSSRRRHTRYWRDWSSDVCSSDLSTQHLFPLLRESESVAVQKKKRVLRFKVFPFFSELKLCIFIAYSLFCTIFSKSINKLLNDIFFSWSTMRIRLSQLGFRLLFYWVKKSMACFWNALFFLSTILVTTLNLAFWT